MFTLEGPVTESIREVEFKVGEQGFSLVFRPVTDEERSTDSALIQKFRIEEDPAMVGVWFIARNNLRKGCVVDWKGVNGPDGNPIKFSREAFERLLRVEGVRDQVIGPINRHFEKTIDEARTGESKGSPSGFTPGGSEPKKSPTSSDGSPEGSQQDNSQT